MVRFLILTLISSIIILSSCKPRNNLVVSDLQTCIDTLSHIPDYQFINLTSIYLDTNTVFKADPKLLWNGKEIIYSPVPKHLMEPYLPGSNSKRDTFILRINKLATNTQGKQVEIYLVNIKELFKFTLNDSESKPVIKRVEQITF